jgi:hypothetical protein
MFSHECLVVSQDSDTSFLLKIHLLGNPKTTRKELRCFDIDMIVESDLSSYKDLVDSVTEKYHTRLLGSSTCTVL